jgi:GNAT superfamily N-acetyltransferase
MSGSGSRSTSGGFLRGFLGVRYFMPMRVCKVEKYSRLRDIFDMKVNSNNVVLTYDLADMNVGAVHGFIQKSYWGKDISRTKFMKSCQFSICVGLLSAGHQIGFARAISDRVTSAYLKDFYVLDDFQRQGLGRRLLDGLMEHSDLNDVQSWYLGTKDAHAFYEACGYKKSPDGIYMYFHRRT